MDSSHYPASSSTSSIQVEPPYSGSASDYAGQQHIEQAPSRVCLGGQNQAQAAEKATGSPSKSAATIFDIHQGTHILQSLDGFAFAIGRDGRFLYISETVSMYLGLSQVEMTGSSVFDYTHQQDHEELARQLGIPCSSSAPGLSHHQKGDPGQQMGTCESPTAPNSVHSQYSAASNETMIEDYVNHTNACGRSNKHAKARAGSKQTFPQRNKRVKQCTGVPIKIEPHQPQRPPSPSGLNQGHSSALNGRKIDTKQSLAGADHTKNGTDEDPLVRQFCIRMKSTLTKRGCQHFKSSGYRVVHVVAHLRSYQSNDHGHLMDPLDDVSSATNEPSQQQHCLSASSSAIGTPAGKLKRARQLKSTGSKTSVVGKATSSIASPSINDGACQPFTTSDTNSGESNSRSATVLEASQSAAQTVARAGFNQSNNEEKIIGMVAVAIALPPPSINELRLESGTFVLRLNLELGITHIEPKITELLHYPVELIAGRSLYSLVHPADVQQVQKCHKELLKKGQMMSGYYRLLARTGGYIWIQSCATMICNNTYNAAASSAQPQPQSQPLAILPAALSSSPGVSTTPIGLNQPTGPLASGQTPALVNVYNLDSNNQYNKMASPGLSSSQLSSSFDNQDQDQCVIFVNYMVTNIVDETEIIDICQSPNYTPLMTSFSGTTSSTTNNDNLFNSPSPACSSPCVSSLRSSNGAGQSQHHNQNSSDTSYAPPTTPNSNASLSSPRRHHHHHQQHQQHQHQIDGKSVREHIKAINGRRAVHKSSKYLSNPAPAGDENGHEHLSNNFASVATEQHQQHVKLHPNGQLGAANQATGAYNYNQTPGSVNLALNKVAMANNDSSWLAHQPGAGGRLLADPVAVYSQQAPEANNQYAAYKAAFNLTDYNQQQQHHQHHHEGGYSNASNAAVAAVYPAASVPVNSWETAATVAAVAAASANHHLSQHHHQGTGTNPYAHLEHTHHHHQHSHLSSAGAAATNHHNPASSYYNYYGYYGNKFI